MVILTKNCKPRSNHLEQLIKSNFVDSRRFKLYQEWVLISYGSADCGTSGTSGAINFFATKNNNEIK